MHVVVKWLGHSIDVATKHYTQVTEDHFRAAVTKAKQNPKQQVPKTHRTSPQPTEAKKESSLVFTGNTESKARQGVTETDGEEREHLRQTREIQGSRAKAAQNAAHFVGKLYSPPNWQ